MSKMKVNIPFLEVAKIPSQREKIKFLGFVDVNEDCPAVFQAMNKARKSSSPSLLYITLMINELLLHNCMLDSRASTNVMSLTVMNQLGLKTTQPYRNVCIMDSREIKVCGLIKDLQVNLLAYPDIIFTGHTSHRCLGCMGYAFVKEMGC